MKFQISDRFWEQGIDLFNKNTLVNKPSALDYAKQFTQTYIDTAGKDIGIRELACSRVQFPYIFQDISDGDLFAGHRRYGPVGFSPEADDVGYFCNTNMIKSEMRKLSPLSKEYADWEKILAFWHKETTKAKIRASFPDKVKNTMPSDDYLVDEYASFPLYRLAGSNLNNKKLIELGISGLRQEVEKFKEKALSQKKDTLLYNNIIAALDLLSELILLYASLVNDKLRDEKDTARKQELQLMKNSLIFISNKKPETFHQAIQLIWLYNMAAGIINFGRMDTYLAGIYVKETKNGQLSEDEALKITKALWRMFPANINQFNGRIIIGGADRENIKECDKFALLAIQATRELRNINPQLSLRCYDGMNKDVYDAAIKAIGEGCTFPILYNDDINIPAVSKALGCKIHEAKNYVPYGCGEYVLEHRSFGSPNAIMNILKCVELALNNGISMLSGKRLGPATGHFEDFNTFEEFFDAYKKQVEYIAPVCALAQDTEYRIAGETAMFPYLSLLYNDCLEKGKGIFRGGIQHLGATVETYGNTNAADSLTAVKKVVFEDKTISKKKLIEVLKNNFKGHYKEYNLLVNAPKYGNDNNYADNMASEVHEHLCKIMIAQKNITNLDSHLVVIINNEMNTWYGKTCIASPDGRRAFTPLAPGNTASGGMDKNGPTALLNSVAKLNPGIHAGAVHNIRFSPETFTRHVEKFKALTGAFFKQGGTQLMVTVTGKKELLDAIDHPEKHQNLLVRVGGFSARFIDLTPEVQQEIISRTDY